jgi:branched-chain amino acid transport system permease protein
MGTIFGPLVGSFVLHTVNEVSRHFLETPGLSLIIYGVILVAIIGYLPNGLIGLFKRTKKKASGGDNA